jgi:hypothetical protein
MNLVIHVYPLTPLLLPWKPITRCTTVVVIIHVENRLVDLLVKASYCSILRHHDRLTTLEIPHTRTIIMILFLIHNRDRCHHLPTVAVPGCHKSITGIVNQMKITNIKQIVLMLFSENLIHGRGLFSRRSIMKAQAASLPFTPVFAALVAIINTKLPQVGELVLMRIISQFRKLFKRNNKVGVF